MKRVSFYGWIGILGLLVLTGLYSLYRQTVEGHHLTGSSDMVPWGIYMSGFTFFLGASAGVTLIGLVIHGFGRDDYKPLATRASLAGILSLMASMLFIMMDVGSIPRMMQVPWVLRNMSSPFVYTGLSYFVFGGLLLAGIYYAVRINQGRITEKVDKAAKWLAIATFLFAFLILSALDGAIFSVVKAREFLNSSLLPPHFAIAALVTGTAIMILVAVLTSRIKGKELVGKETLSHMGKLLALFITVTLFFDFFDLLVLNYSETQHGIEAWNLLTGNMAPFFALYVGGLIVALLILLTRQGRTITGLSASSILTIAAVAAYRYNLVIVGMLVPLLPGLPEVHYSPTWIEISVTTGIIALVMLLYTLLTIYLPMEENVPQVKKKSGRVKK